MPSPEKPTGPVDDRTPGTTPASQKPPTSQEPPASQQPAKPSRQEEEERAKDRPKPGGDKPLVDEESEESFPASDPPANY